MLNRAFSDIKPDNHEVDLLANEQRKWTVITVTREFKFPAQGPTVFSKSRFSDQTDGTRGKRTEGHVVSRRDGDLL